MVQVIVSHLGLGQILLSSVSRIAKELDDSVKVFSQETDRL